VANVKITLGTLAAQRGLNGPVWFAVSVIWFLTGLTGAVYHAMTKHDADSTALGFLVFAFAGFLVPIISNLELPGGAKIQFVSAEVSANVTTLEQKYALATTDIAQMLQSLIGAQTRLAAVFRRGAIDPPLAYSVAKQTLVDAMKSSTRWLVPQGSDANGGAPEAVRITVWRWDEEEKALVYLLGTPTPAQEVSLTTGGLGVGDDDYVGDAWRNKRISNHAGSPPSWRALSQGKDQNGNDYPGPQAYGGVMFVPVLDDGRPVGLIEIDRVAGLRFDSNAEVVAWALADLVSGVLGHSLVRWGTVA
jgi:hypothetical protein